MAEIVYLLCALASTFCAILLVRNYRRNGVRLALWTCLCFAGLALNNILLFVDLVLLPTTIDLALFRTAVALTAVLLLVIGLTWEET
jgi:hypothetical protein